MIEPLREENGQNFILSEEVYNGVCKILEKLANKTRAELVVFCDSNGYPVSHVGANPDMDLWALSSLAANNFSATAEMATMIGEGKSFKFLFHEGERVNTYISDVGFNFILLIVFNVDVAIGMIRIFTNKAIDELTRLLKSETEKETRDFMDLEFKDLLSKELDRSLKL